MTDAAQSEFTITECSEFGWRVFWPALFLNFLCLHRSVIDATGWQLLAVVALNFAVAVFAVLPWAIRRALRLDFKRFHLVIRRPGIEQESRDLTYGESLKLSALAAFGTAGIVVLPYQWRTLYHNTHWLIELSVWLAICLGASTLIGVLLLRNPFDSFSLNIRRPVQP